MFRKLVTSLCIFGLMFGLISTAFALDKQGAIDAYVDELPAEFDDKTGKAESEANAMIEIMESSQAEVVDTMAGLDKRVKDYNINDPKKDDANKQLKVAKDAVDDFHARYSAIARFYRYVILNRKMKSALMRSQVTWCYNPLDEAKMQQAAQVLVGAHDFSSFRAQGCQSLSPNRLMHFINVHREGENVVIELSANAFLHHMVRNIAGVLMEIGMGKRPVDWTQELLSVKDRKQGGVTAPPFGLYLGGVFYPEKFGIDKHPIFDLLPADVQRFEH